MLEVDLKTLKTEGDFPCPKCEATISPEDDSKEPYVIKKVSANKASVRYVVIHCNNCKSDIKITGFEGI